MSAEEFSSDLHAAIAGVCLCHGYGMLSRLVMAAEFVDDDGELGLLVGSLPQDMPVWDRMGMLRYAVADTEAGLTASRIVEDQEEE